MNNHWHLQTKHICLLSHTLNPLFSIKYCTSEQVMFLASNALKKSPSNIYHHTAKVT